MRRLKHLSGAARLAFVAVLCALAFAAGRSSAVPRYYPMQVRTKEVIVREEKLGSSLRSRDARGSASASKPSLPAAMTRVPPSKKCLPGGTATESFQQCIEREAKK